MPFVPEISAEFSAPTGYSSTAPLHPSSEVSVASIMRLSGRFFCYWPQDFPAVSDFTDRDFPTVPVVNGREFSGHFCCYWPRDFPAVSVVACWDFPALTFQAWECKKSPSRDQKAGIFRPYLLFLAWIFRP